MKFYITTSLDGIIDKHSDGSKVGDVLNLFTGRSHLYGYADPINTGGNNYLAFCCGENPMQQAQIMLKIAYMDNILQNQTCV